MQLRFYPKPGRSPKFPGLVANGQAVPRIGRTLEPGDEKAGVAAKLAASKEPVVVDAMSDDGRRLAKLCRRDDDLWPADKQTADFCGRPFVAVEQDEDGEWHPAKTVRRAAPAQKAAE